MTTARVIKYKIRKQHNAWLSQLNIENEIQKQRLKAPCSPAIVRNYPNNYTHFSNDEQKIMSTTKPQICICLCTPYKSLYYAHTHIVYLTKQSQVAEVILRILSHLEIPPHNPNPSRIIGNADCVPDMAVCISFKLILADESNLTLFLSGCHFIEIVQIIDGFLVQYFAITFLGGHFYIGFFSIWYMLVHVHAFCILCIFPDWSKFEICVSLLFKKLVN